MKPKTLAKLLIDLFMTLLMLLLMTYALVGEGLHEWLGVGMFALFIAHHLLNLSWHKNLARGSYSASRAVGLALDVLVFICMLCLIWSSVVLSRYVFAPLGARGDIALARVLHLLGSYWGFVLMSVHLGLHWRMVTGILGRKNAAPKSAARAWLLRISALALSAFGLYAFIQNRLLDYLFFRTQFVFIDFSKPLWLALAEYLGIMTLFACCAYYAASALKKQKTRGSEKI